MLNNEEFRSLKSIITTKEENLTPINTLLWEELRYLRSRPRKQGKRAKQNNLSQPVAIFSKSDRLMKGMGTEITLIMRSKACTWAHSKSGGCSMCGYWNDKADESITGEDYWNQFQKALDKYKDLLGDSEQEIILKIFTSGSFCDPNEIPFEIQTRILQTIQKYGTVKEIVLESRPEYLNSNNLTIYKQIVPDKYIEIAIGLETMNDYARINLINKGFSRKNFEQKTQLLHQFGFGVKAYVLFKPPFLTEYAAIKDLQDTLLYCFMIGVDTISINPTNIQAHTICEELWKDHKFRSPWLFSLLLTIKNTIQPHHLEQCRIICDPSAIGKPRGVHNCEDDPGSNQNLIKILQEFIKTQDLSVIPESYEGKCFESYFLALFYGNM